jgi:phosphoesterase RecJ-like protein
MLGDEALIDKEIAECIYAGIMTDTGSFRHPVTSAKVHRTIAGLIERGADNSRVHKLVYDNNNEARLRMLGYILFNRLVVVKEYATAYIAITKDELKEFNSMTGDTEGFVNYALSIEGIVLAALIIDRTEAVKISFRSTGSFSVNKFARNHFNGGGHENASGGRSELSLDETVAKFLALLPTYQEELLHVSEQLNN